MGQTESNPKLDYMLDDKQEKLIQQYSGVEIDSIYSEYTNNKCVETSTNKDLGSDASDFVICNDSNKCTNLEQKLNLSENVKLQQNEPKTLIVERKYSSEFDSGNVSRKSSRGFDSLKEHGSSSEKIFEEHAEYANELLNAPYLLSTKYSSLETINSKDNPDLNSVSDNSNTCTSKTENPADKVPINNSDKAIVINIVPVEKSEHRSVNAIYTNVPDSKALEAQENSNRDHIDGISNINLLKKKFENQNSCDVIEKQSQVKPGKLSTCILHYLEQEVDFHAAQKQFQCQYNEQEKQYENVGINTNEQTHEPLCRKKAIIVSINRDLKTHDVATSCNTIKNSQPVGRHIFNSESVYTNSNFRNDHKSLDPAKSNNTVEGVSSLSNLKYHNHPPTHVDKNSSRILEHLPNVLPVNKTNSTIVTSHIKLKGETVCGNNSIIVNEGNLSKLNAEHSRDTSEVTDKPAYGVPKNKARVASLRRKFENAGKLDKDITINNKNDQYLYFTGNNERFPLKYDVNYENNKYPIVKSKSDGYIKFPEKGKVQLNRKASKEESDGVYEEYAVRTSFRKDSSHRLSRKLNNPVNIKKSNLTLDYDHKSQEDDDYLVAIPSISDQKSRDTVKGTVSQTHSQQNKNFISESENCQITARQANSCEEVLYDDCVVVEGYKGSQENNKITSENIAKTTSAKEMDFHRSKKESKSKRHRRKSDSSTSNLSDSSTPVTKSSKKWKKSKDHKEKSRKKNMVVRDEEDPGLSQQWGSMITEYQEKYVSNDKARHKHSPMQEKRGNRIANMEQYNNVKQVFNRGMVLPVKRAPPGMSAQEVESDSGITDYSTHSWTAMHHPVGIRAHIDGMDYNADGGQTSVKQKVNDSFSSSIGAHHHTERLHPSRMRFSSQSSQYTSDAPMSPGRQRRAMFNESNQHHQQYNGYNDISVGHRGISRHSSNYSERPLTPEVHHQSRLAKHYSDYPSSPEGPRRMRLVKQTVSYSSDGAMSPKIVKRYKPKSLPREPFVNGDFGHVRERSSSRERLDYGSDMRRQHHFVNSLSRPSHAIEYNTNSLGRFQPHYPSRARSLSRDRLNHVDVQRNMKKRSMSSDRLDYYRPNTPSLDRRMRERNHSREHLEHGGVIVDPSYHREMMHVGSQKKTHKKKSIDGKAKKFVDNVIDEAIDRFTLSPKSRRKSKSKDNLSSVTTRRNVVNTTNIYNEYIEDDSHLHEDDRLIDRKAYSDIEDHRLYYDDRREHDSFEHDLRMWNNHHMTKPSLLRPQPIDNSVMTERRACIKPVAGSGITRDGSAPPPKSAYKNYDFELSVGPSQYSGEERKSKEHNNSQYPHITFGPQKAKSEENLLSESRKSSFFNPPIHSVPIKSNNSVNHAYTDNYESDPEDKSKFNPPTLTRGMVTKIIHKLDEDINKLTSLRGKNSKIKKRPQIDLSMVNEDNYVTNTWPRQDISDKISDSRESAVGATLYGTLPSVGSEWQPRSVSSYTTYLDKNGAHQTQTSPTSGLTNTKLYFGHKGNPQHQLIQTSHTEMLLQPESPKHAEAPSNIDHARFKMYHGQNMNIHPRDTPNTNMNMKEENSNLDANLITPNIEREDTRYGAFSNEQMIVADLIDGTETKRPENKSMKDKYKVRKVGQLFGTQPDVSMSKQQTLNFFLFNQSKSGDEPERVESPRMTYMARNVEFSNHGKKKQQTDLFVNEDVLSDSDTELREYMIHHKQTQTPTVQSSKQRKTKKKNDKKYIVVQQHPSKPKNKHIETTHYITQEREIEKVHPYKEMREMSIQTDREEQAHAQYVHQPQYTVERIKSPRQREYKLEQDIVEQSSFINRPIITESRHMEKHNYEFPSSSESTELTPPPSPPVPQKSIPVIIQPNLNQQYLEKLEEEYQQQHNIVPVSVGETTMEVAVRSDDEETVILETTEIEEKEQRIAMAIYEEVEFSAKRTEGGKTVNIEGTSEIPTFWEPDKFEAVVDHKKKKMTRVKETSHEQDGRRTKHLGMLHPAIEDIHMSSNAAIENSGYKHKPMTIQEEKKINSQHKREIAEEITEKIAALDKVLEDELAKDDTGANEPDVIKKNVKSDTKINEMGEPITENYINYEKMVHLPDNTSNSHEILVLKSPPKYNEMFTRAINLSPQSQRRVKNTTYAPYGQSKSTESWKTGYTPTQHSPSLSHRINKVKSSYQHTPLEPMFMTERGGMYGRTDKINHHPGVSVVSSVDPTNVSFVKKGEEGVNISQEYQSKTGSVSIQGNKIPPPPPPLPLTGLNGSTVHSEQSEPVQQTHYEKDKDGNLVKVTEWQHKLTKTVEYPDEEQQNQSLFMNKQRNKSQSFNELPEAGYIKMNLHETISSERPSENETENTEESETLIKRKTNGPDVIEETEIGVKPFHYESKQSTLKVEDDPEVSKERQFLYDIKKAKLKPIPKAYKNGWGIKHTYGTMSTHL